ncbi:MAG: phosphodiester glycosidase family protein [Pyrinomonadaceae bacterium]
MFDRLRVLVSLIGVLCALCGSIFAQDWKSIHDGVEYAHVDQKISGDPIKINLLRLDLISKVRLDVHHALDGAIGTETTSSIATRHGAVAAINGGFFRLDSSIWAGDAAGVLKIDGKFLSEPTNGRIALMIKNYPTTTQAWFDRPLLSIALKIRNRRVAISGVNRERRENDSVIYTPEFGRTTLTDGNGLEVVIAGGRITKILHSGGSNEIPNNGLVISASGSKADGLRQAAKLGSRAVIQYGDWQNTDPLVFMDEIKNLDAGPGLGISDDVTNGVPQLIKNGKIDITWEQEKASKSFAEMRHPRTAVAKLKDGKFLMIAVDGRQPGVSVGMTLQELAEYLLSLGATDAMNLDGGGSTTMYVDGKVVNTPSDKEGERKVSDAILVTLRKNSRPSRR